MIYKNDPRNAWYAFSKIMIDPPKQQDSTNEILFLKDWASTIWKYQSFTNTIFWIFFNANLDKIFWFQVSSNESKFHYQIYANIFQKSNNPLNPKHRNIFFEVCEQIWNFWVEASWTSGRDSKCSGGFFCVLFI